jgi:heme-degrading monooxygenase HmoA
MLELASRMPGFVSFKSFASDDGERISVIEFEGEEQLRAWREHPEHRKAQELGRTRFYEEYHVQVCAPLRDYGFSRDSA